jgi:hypothetical protein
VTALASICPEAPLGRGLDLQRIGLHPVRRGGEYDAAQARGEVQRHGGQMPRDVADANIPSVADLGMRRDQIHDARLHQPSVERKTMSIDTCSGRAPGARFFITAVQRPGCLPVVAPGPTKAARFTHQPILREAR